MVITQKIITQLSYEKTGSAKTTRATNQFLYRQHNPIVKTKW